MEFLQKQSGDCSSPAGQTESLQADKGAAEQRLREAQVPQLLLDHHCSTSWYQHLFARPALADRQCLVEFHSRLSVDSQ